MYINSNSIVSSGLVSNCIVLWSCSQLIARGALTLDTSNRYHDWKTALSVPILYTLCTTLLVQQRLEHLVYSTIAIYSGKSCQQTMLENSEHHALFVQRTLLCVQCLCTLASCVSRPR